MGGGKGEVVSGTFSSLSVWRGSARSWVGGGKGGKLSVGQDLRPHQQACLPSPEPSGDGDAKAGSGSPPFSWLPGVGHPQAWRKMYFSISGVVETRPLILSLVLLDSRQPLRSLPSPHLYVPSVTRSVHSKSRASPPTSKPALAPFLFTLTLTTPPQPVYVAP